MKRYPYRSVQEVEDALAHLLKALTLLEASRRHAATPEAWALLNEQTRHVEEAYYWLRDLRAEMRDGPDES